MGRGPDTDAKPEPSRRHLSWFLFFRVLIITLFLGGTIAYQLRGGLDRAHPALPYLYLLVGISYLHALLSAAVLPSTRRLRLFTQTQIVWDLLFCSALIYISGGTESIFSFLFILIIVAGAVFLTRKELLFTASAAAILYGSLLDLQYYGYLPLAAGLSFPVRIDGLDVFYAVFVNVVAFFLTALLAGTLSERLRKSERALERKEIDYEELEELNRTILANVTGGLMIVNPLGRIRSFNAAAERITGYTLRDVYDRDVRSLFPGLSVFNGRFKVVSRGEGRFVDGVQRERVLGYASSLVKDPQEKTVGLLVTFQDLTQLKDMEAQLQRADRLAAVGRFASGMAHEIRNPLASISGSVQLLMEGSHVTAEDRRLMGIVVKEADRLSALLTDFLVYARPTPPKTAEEDVSLLLDELAAMVAADPRFSAVEIRRDCPPAVRMRFDRQQLHQALWNLAINGAEAMAGGGILRLGCDPREQAIYVEDSGPGIPDAVREKIFDPFFTTKAQGTGLGLATVHTIIEGHGGSIEAAPGAASGTRVTIRLPQSGGE